MGLKSQMMFHHAPIVWRIEMPVINKTVYFRFGKTLSEHPLTRMQTRILSERDTSGVTGVFIDDILTMWFDETVGLAPGSRVALATAE